MKPRTSGRRNAPEVGPQLRREAEVPGEETPFPRRKTSHGNRRGQPVHPNRLKTWISQDVASSHWTNEFMTTGDDAVGIRAAKARAG